MTNTVWTFFGHQPTHFGLFRHVWLALVVLLDDRAREVSESYTTNCVRLTGTGVRHRADEIVAVREKWGEGGTWLVPSQLVSPRSDWYPADNHPSLLSSSDIPRVTDRRSTGHVIGRLRPAHSPISDGAKPDIDTAGTGKKSENLLPVHTDFQMVGVKTSLQWNAGKH